MGALTHALRNFFCWNGAPWHSGHTPNLLKTSANLHRSFTQERVDRTYLVPLDLLSLEDGSSGTTNAVKNVAFGPNEIVCLEHGDLARRVPADALARFGPRYEFPLQELDGFYWLVTTRSEDAGPIHRRTWIDLLNLTLAELGSVPLFRSLYPSPVENALFVLLLTLLKEPNDVPWRPFHVPWVFSFTNDRFADPVPPPDASALTRTIVGDSNHQFEVPDQSECFDMGANQQTTLREWWTKFDLLLAHSNSTDASFHPLTRHFFVKALADNGVDEIISNISCLEATLMLKQSRGRPKLKKRFAQIVNDTNTQKWAQHAYDLRDHYLHSLADPQTKVAWKDLARIRWAIASAVRKYVDLACLQPRTDRTSLLRQLSP